MKKVLTIVFFGFFAAVGRSESPSDYYYDPNAEDIKSGAYVIVKGKTYPFYPPETPNIPSDVKLSDADKNILEVMNLIAALEMEIEALAETMYDRVVMDLQFHTAGNETTVSWTQSGAAGATGGSHTIKSDSVYADGSTIKRDGDTLSFYSSPGETLSGARLVGGKLSWERINTSTSEVDNASIGLTAAPTGGGKLEIKNFSSAGAYGYSVARLLESDDGGGDITLISRTGGGVVYIPIGKLVVDADGVTIENKATEDGVKKFGLKNPPPLLAADGIPYGAYSTPDGISWAKVPLWNPTNIAANVDGTFVVTNTEGKIALNLDGACETSISEMLQDGDDQGHMFLSRIGDGEGAIPHWTPLGEILPPSGGGAIKFVGTDGGEAVVGSGAATNSVTFASAADSNVKVSVAGGDGDVTITIGVYYK